MSFSKVGRNKSTKKRTDTDRRDTITVKFIRKEVRKWLNELFAVEYVFADQPRLLGHSNVVVVGNILYERG